jgi:amidase
MKRVLLALASTAALTACATQPMGPYDSSGPTVARPGAPTVLPTAYAVEERTIPQLVADMAAGRVTSETLTRAYLHRIQTVDQSGAFLRSVLSVNPNAVADAQALDAERRAGRVRGPLHGVPFLLKDNIETRELPTTAGSAGWADNRTGRDAPIAARLRAAGAVILGKANLSEWANIRFQRLDQRLERHGRPGAQSERARSQPLRLELRLGRGGGRQPRGRDRGHRDQRCRSSGPALRQRGVVGFKPLSACCPRTHIVPISQRARILRAR